MNIAWSYIIFIIFRVIIKDKFNYLTVGSLLRVFFVLEYFIELGHKKTCAASGCTRSLAGLKSQQKMYCMPIEQAARYIILVQRGSQSLQTLKPTHCH